MALTLPELKQRLAVNYDADQLLELLGLTDSEVLVEVLSDYIEENYDKLLEEVGTDEFSNYSE